MRHRALLAVGGQAWSPASLPGLVAWFSGSVGIHDTSGAIDQWDDQSGNGYHVTATGSQRPTTGATINGLPVVRFTALSNQSLTRASVSIPQPLTVLAVVKAISFPGSFPQFIGNLTNPEPAIYADTGHWGMYAGDLRAGAATVDTSVHQFVCLFSGGGSELWVDGILDATGNPGSSGRTDIAIGADGTGHAWDGYVAEVAIMSSTITANDRTNWAAYCSARWSTS